MLSGELLYVSFFLISQSFLSALWLDLDRVDSPVHSEHQCFGVNGFLDRPFIYQFFQVIRELMSRKVFY
jgi:hypothetical protein